MGFLFFESRLYCCIHGLDKLANVCGTCNCFDHAGNLCLSRAEDVADWQ